MRTFEITFLKNSAVMAGRQPAQVAKLTLHTDKERFDIPCPAGYTVMSICEVLPEITIKDENVRN